jgi:uncharacterized protein
MVRVLIVVFACLILSSIARAAEESDLYRAQAIVTGTVDPERTRGFKAALQDVVVKLTGDARLESSRKLQPLLAVPHSLVERFDYEDRMKGIPVHDEQGTRERPHYLRVKFKKTATDAALEKLGLKKWPSDRPVLAVWLGVRTALAPYVLEDNGPNGYGQRAVLMETSARRGLPIALPTKGQDAVRFDDIASNNIAKLKRASRRADAYLVGVLSITEAGYWNIDWQLFYQNRSRMWSLHDITFDTALKNGLQTAALIFSGNAKM